MSFAYRSIIAAGTQSPFFFQSSKLRTRTGFFGIAPPPDISKSQFLKVMSDMFFSRWPAIMLDLSPPNEQSENATFLMDAFAPLLPQLKLSESIFSGLIARISASEMRTSSICAPPLPW